MFADDTNPPSYRGEPNSLHFEWTTIVGGNNPPDVFTQGPSDFPLSIRIAGPNGGPPGNLRIPPIANVVIVDGVNFVDELDYKDVRVQVTYTGTITNTVMRWADFNQETGDALAIATAPCVLLNHVDEIPGSYYYEDWRCMPNPDTERIRIFHDGSAQITQVVMDTISYAAVGGTIFPIDTTALLLAGMQINLAWMIPVALSAVGIGVFLVRKKI